MVDQNLDDDDQTLPLFDWTEPEFEVSDNARLYGSGVTSSADIGSRKRRLEALEKELGNIF